MKREREVAGQGQGSGRTLRATSRRKTSPGLEDARLCDLTIIPQTLAWPSVGLETVAGHEYEDTMLGGILGKLRKHVQVGIALELRIFPLAIGDAVFGVGFKVMVGTDEGAGVGTGVGGSE